MGNFPKRFLSAFCLLGVVFGMARDVVCTRTYQEDTTAFANAQIGYAPMAGSTDSSGATLRYLELTWREVEPEEGQYAWDAIEQKYGLAALRRQGSIWCCGLCVTYREKTSIWISRIGCMRRLPTAAGTAPLMARDIPRIMQMRSYGLHTAALSQRWQSTLMQMDL